MLCCVELCLMCLTCVSVWFGFGFGFGSGFDEGSFFVFFFLVFSPFNLYLTVPKE